MRSTLLAFVLLGGPALAADEAPKPATRLELSVPFVKGEIDLAALGKVPGVVQAERAGDTVKMVLDAYARVALLDLEAAAGARVDRQRFELPACSHIVMQAPCGGGGKAPCLETAHRGCFNAGPVTTALGKLDGVNNALLADMRPGGGDLAWLIAHDKSKKLLAEDVIAAAQLANNKAVFRDFVLCGVFADDKVYIPSEFLPRARPGAVKSAAPRLDWLHSSKDALTRARAENKMILLVAHHFD